MITSALFPNKNIGISSNVSLDELTLIKQFSGYLNSTENSRIITFSNSSPNGIFFDMPYITRWSPSYKKKIIAKMYAVEEYCKHSNKASIVTLLTLTGYQDGNSSINTLGKINTREELFGDNQSKTGLKGGWRWRGCLSGTTGAVCRLRSRPRPAKRADPNTATYDDHYSNKNTDNAKHMGAPVHNHRYAVHPHLRFSPPVLLETSVGGK